MKFRNKKTGQELQPTEPQLIELLKNNPNYEEVKETSNKKEIK